MKHFGYVTNVDEGHPLYFGVYANSPDQIIKSIYKKASKTAIHIIGKFNPTYKILAFDVDQNGQIVKSSSRELCHITHDIQVRYHRKRINRVQTGLGCVHVVLCNAKVDVPLGFSVYKTKKLNDLCEFYIYAGWFSSRSECKKNNHIHAVPDGVNAIKVKNNIVVTVKNTSAKIDWSTYENLYPRHMKEFLEFYKLNKT